MMNSTRWGYIDKFEINEETNCMYEPWFEVIIHFSDSHFLKSVKYYTSNRVFNFDINTFIRLMTPLRAAKTTFPQKVTMNCNKYYLQEIKVFKKQDE